MTHREELEWQDQANCRGENPELFFPISSKPEEYKKALEICDGCPVKQECLDWIMGVETWESREGIFGGATPDDRAKLARGPRRHRQAAYVRTA